MKEPRIGDGRGNLPNRDALALLFEQADIGEGAAGIDTNSPRHYPCHSAGDPLPIIMGHSRLAQTGGTEETAILRDGLSGPA